jgi:hypothetical protein
MRLKAQILKDYDLSSSTTTASRKEKTHPKFAAQYEQQLKEIWRTHVEANASGLYECSINHGYDCGCCTPIIKESVTCPTKKERSSPRSRGRPRLRR